MGFYFRKSVRVGPFRVNVSRGGVGLSLGAGGLRQSVSSRGRRYTTFGIPGTGGGYRTQTRGCATALLLFALPVAACGAECLRRVFL